MRTVIFCLIAASGLHAQNHLTATATTRYFDVVRRNLESSADLMPPDKYGFRLTQGQMTFAEWLIHSIQRNYSDCAVMRGEPTPEMERKAPALRAKEEVTRVLKESFAYCAEALKGMTDEKAGSSPQMAYAFLHLVAHNNEIYGNVVGYLRVNGILPPSTASRQKKK